MKLSELNQLYPNGFLAQEPLKDERFFTLYFNNQWFHIPKQTITEKEKKLLLLLFPQDSLPADVVTHSWFQYLYNHQKNLPKTEGTYRIIQINLKNETPVAQEWLTHFAGMFQEVDDFFFINKKQAVIIEKQAKIQYLLADIEGMLLTLESDFLVQARLFVGTFHTMTSQFIDFFKEEQHLFQTYQKDAIRLFSFQDVALDYLTHQAIKNSKTMQDLKISLQFDDDLNNIIKTLWQEQGNITSASKKLYIHRNTLQYRLDKFYERTGFSLKNMNDLTLCYLLIN